MMESLEQTFSKFQAEAERVGRAFSAGVIGHEEYEGRMLILIERVHAQLIIGYGIGWTPGEEWPEEKEQTELDLIEESKHILSKDN